MTRKQQTADVVFRGLEAGLRMFRWIALILFVLFWFSGFQKVGPGNEGLLLRFGKLQGATDTVTAGATAGPSRSEPKQHPSEECHYHPHEYSAAEYRRPPGWYPLPVEIAGSK